MGNTNHSCEGCNLCNELQAEFEGLTFQQARLHNQLELAEHLSDSQLLRCLKLEAYQVTARLRKARQALTEHRQESHFPPGAGAPPHVRAA